MDKGKGKGNQFEVRSDPREERKFREERGGGQKRRLGMVSVMIFTPDFRHNVIGFSTKYRSHKHVGGGIEEKDLRENALYAHDESLTELAAIERETEEETSLVITRANLVAFDSDGKERHFLKMDYGTPTNWGGSIKHFIALLSKKVNIRPIEVEENSKFHKFTDQDYWHLEDILRGKNRHINPDDPKNVFNTNYSIALWHCLREMREMDAFRVPRGKGKTVLRPELAAVIEDLEQNSPSGKNLLSNDYLAELKVKLEKENEERRTTRRF